MDLAIALNVENIGCGYSLTTTYKKILGEQE